jgi:hypothetical protein
MIRVTQGMLAVRLLLLGALAGTLSAQIGYPGGGYPGGGYPGGGYPGGGRGGPLGGRGRGRTTDSTPSNSKGRKDNAPVVITTTGILRVVAGNQFVLEADDHRIITYKAGDKMTVLKDGKPAELTSFATADHLSVDSTMDDMGFFTATGVTFSAAGTAREREEASRTWDLPNLASSSARRAAENKRSGNGDDERPTLRRNGDSAPTQQSASTTPGTTAPGATTPGTTAAPATAPPTAAAESDDNRPTTMIRPADPTPDADDPGRPEIRRGKPAPRASARNTEPEPLPRTSPAGAAQPPDPGATDNAGTVAAAPDFIPVQEDPIIVKAKEAGAAFVGVLPNFFCRQLTTRYESDRPKDGWQAIDTISADLAYENGHESYTNIKVGNKEQKGSMEDVGGSWSTGEFASLLDDLFDPGTAATFRKSGQDTISGRSATTFKFDVTREHSHWRIIMAAQLYYPAFRGTVWIDRETSRVLRLEMESRNMPLLFPLAKVEEAIDYDFVRLATPQPFLLPTVSEVLSCQQGSSHCSRNRIEFRNYRKFGAESGITFDEKQ